MKKIAFLLLACFSFAAFAENDAAVSPYRPSVSSPAQLPAAGQLELELGGLHTKTGSARRDSVPYQFKLGFNPEWGVLLGGEAHVIMKNEDGSRDRGVGDTTLIVKRAFIVDEATAYGLELGRKFPTANSVIGSGKSDYTMNAIYSRDIDTVHMDANINLTRVGLIEPGAGRMQTGISASFSVPVAAQWGATVELSGLYRKKTPSTSQLLLAGTYSPSKRMTIDFGLARGLSRASQDWSFFGGIVVPLVQLW